MEKIKKTYTEAIQIVSCLSVIDTKVKDKLSYAVVKLIGGYRSIIERYNEEVSDINVKHCFTNEKGIIEYDTVGESQNFKYTREAMQQKKKDIKALNSREIEVPIYIYDGPDRDPDISIGIKVALEGILFKSQETTDKKGKK